jgi:tRNA A-37 threonylcarbamoyl transferase component Bud32
MPISELAGLEDKYEVLAKLREGGMGAVYKVRHRLLEEIRVIKVIRPHLEADEGLRRRFLGEARSAVRLRHPNIAQIYDFTVSEDGTSVMVMEFIDGRDLAELLRLRGRLSVDLVLELGLQALKALSYLHRNDFVHRDISPDNIMLTQDVEGQPLVKLIDLGIAKPLGGSVNLTGTGLFLGKIRYASPEQFGTGSGKISLDQRSDLYSFGIALYELATGHHPIAGNTSEALVAGHLFHPPRPFSETDPAGALPAGLRAAILKALAKDPAERFATALAFCDALTEVQDGWEEPDLTATLLERTLIAPRADDPSLAVERADDPEARLGDLQQRVEELLKEGRLADAEAAVAAEEARDLDATAVGTLRHRLQALRSSVERDLATARSHRVAGDFTAAREALDRVRAVEPANPEAAALDAQIEAATERRRREAEEDRARIRDLLDAGHLPEARKALAEATAAHGRTDLFAQIEQRIAQTEAAQRAREDAVAELGRRVEALLAEGRPATADGELGRLRARHGDHPALEELARRIAERRSTARQHLAAALAHLDAGDLTAAAAGVEEVLALDRELPEAHQLQSRVELGMERHRHGLADAASRVEAELKAGDVEAAAACLADAEAAYGATGPLADLRARLERLAAEQRGRRQRHDADLREVEEHVAAGRLDEARSALGRARSDHGSTPELEALRGRLGEAVEGRREAAERARQEDRRERRRQVAALLREARERVDHEDFPGANRALERAQELEPGDPAIAALADHIASSRERATLFPDVAGPAPGAAPSRPRRRAAIAAALAVAAVVVAGTILWWPSAPEPGDGTGEERAVPRAEVLREGLAGVEMGSFHALVIGNNDYRAGLPSLHSAEPDARAVASALAGFGFDVELVTNATRDTTLRALERVGGAVREGDNLLLFYAGHGFVDEGGRGYWQPVDAEQANTANWISSVEISELLTDSPARRVLVIADSCFSGALLEEERPDGGALTPDAVRARAGRRARLAITSGALQPVLDAGRDGHSVFSGALLEVLDDGGPLDAQGLFLGVMAKLEPAVARLGGEQTPRLGSLETDDEGDFFLVPAGTP